MRLPATLPLFGLAFLALILAIASVARADTATVCKTSWADLKTAILPFKAAEITDPQPFIAQFNAVPPQSTVAADQVFALRLPATVLVIFVDHGCVSGEGELKTTDFDTLMQGDPT